VGRFSLGGNPGKKAENDLFWLFSQLSLYKDNLSFLSDFSSFFAASIGEK